MTRDAREFWDRIDGGAAWDDWLAQLFAACGRALRRRTRLAPTGR
jgi:hypothetical protein